MFDPSKENINESQSAIDGGSFSSNASAGRGIDPTPKSKPPSTVKLSPYSANPRGTGVVLLCGGVVSFLGYQGMLVWLDANNFEFVIFGVIGCVLGVLYLLVPNLMVAADRAFTVAATKPNYNRNRNIIIWGGLLIALLFGLHYGMTTK